jgi:radical SAM protein with 4Fe4S-binding SPASM domain
MSKKTLMRAQMSYPLNLYRALYNYHHDKTTLSNHPMVGLIEPTNKCQLNCWFCARTEIEKYGAGYMTDETFSSVVNEKNNCMFRHTMLFMRGEPLLHPKIVEFTRKLKQHANTVGLSTNGLLLNREMAKDLVEAGVSHFDVSFEGVSKEAYEKMRVGGNYEQVEKNLLGLLELRKNAPHSYIISVICVICGFTCELFPAFKEKWLKHGVDRVVPLPLKNWNGMMDYPEATEYPRRSEPSCFVPWVSMYIKWDGEVSPCCSYVQPSGLGNVNDTDLMDIWNGEGYVRLRESLLNGEPSLPICRTCDTSNFADKFMLTVKREPTFPFSPSFYHFTSDMAKKVLRRLYHKVRLNQNLVKQTKP